MFTATSQNSSLADTQKSDSGLESEKQSPKGLSQAISQIHRDAKKQARVYLQEVVTPYGGE